MVNPSEKQSDMEISVRGAIAERAFGLAEQLITNTVENGNGNPSFLYAALAEIRNAQQDFDSAQELAEKSLERDPHNPEARMQLAQAHLGKHEIEQAKALLADLADQCRMDARFHAIQARLHLHQHDFAKASEYANRAAELAPSDSGCHALKAQILLAMPSPGPKELKKAMEYARKAKQIDKASVEAWKLLLKAAVISGNDREFNKILQSARRQFPDSPDIDTEVAEYMTVNREYEAAETTLRRIIGQHRGFAPAYQALANLYVQKRQWAEAVDNAYNALGFAPYDLRTWRLVGIALARNEEYNHAMGWLYKVISADPDDLLVATELARSLRKLHEFDAAHDIYQQILAELGDRPAPSVLQDFGLLLIEMERNTEAVEILRRSHALAKEDVTLQMSLALALTNAGEFQEAREIYLGLMNKHPGVGEAYLYYTSITKMKDEAGFAEKVLENIDQALDPKQEEAMYYAVSKTYEDQQDYTAAFENLNKACSLHKERCGYNEAASMAGFALIKNTFTRDFLERFQGCGDPSHRPIFVLGMPRSGTTLVEQILSSHPKVVGGGELLFMDMTLRNHAAMTETQMVGSFAHLTCDAARELAEGYLSLLAHIGREDQMVVDKMPHNFMHIGLISILFPNAKIIHVKRDPMAICLSCYKQRFTEGHTYSFNLEDLGRYYLAHLDLMEHWYQLLPERIFPVEYEKLTGGFEQQVREMIDYCGLEWDDACLSFHKNRRAVRTASLAQIRKPIYTDSVSFWRNYEEQLQPLSEILRAGGAI